MNVKSDKTVGLVAILIAIILAIGLFSLSCVSGLTAIGWSGGTVADGVLYTGSNGQLVAINLADESRQSAEALTAVTQSGLFGCSAGLGCGTGTSRVPIYGTPVVSGDLVFIAGYNGKIYAYNTSNLATRWVYPREGNLNPFVGGIAIAQDKLIIGCADGVVLALDAQTGDKLFEFKAGDKIWGTPAVDGDTLYIGSFDKNLYALNIADLSPKWDKPFETQGAIIATPLVYNGVVYVGSFDKYLYAIDANTGVELHKFSGENWFWAQPVVVEGTLYAGCMDGFVYALKADTLEKITDFDLGSPVASQPVVVDNYVVFASSKGIIFKIDSSSREKTLVKQFEKTVINGPLTAYQGIVYIHPQAGVLERINVSTGASLTGIPLQS